MIPGSKGENKEASKKEGEAGTRMEMRVEMSIVMRFGS